MGEDAVQKRLFIGGLFEGITTNDLKKRFEKFGKIDEVDLREKKDAEGKVFKRFAYVNINSDEKQIKKCINAYNKTKWNGHELLIQQAKESYLTKFKQERESTCTPATVVEEASLAPVRDVIKGVAPGTAVPDRKNWVVGKYGQVMPLVYIRKKDKSKVMKYDPSKYTHAYKKLDTGKNSDQVPEKSVEDLTWNLDVEVSENSRKRMGIFPEYTPPKKKQKLLSKKARDAKRSDEVMSSDEEEEFEVVGLTRKNSPKSKHGNLSRKFEADSNGSDTDTVCAKSQNRTVVGTDSSDTDTVCAKINSSKKATTGNSDRNKICTDRNLHHVREQKEQEESEEEIEEEEEDSSDTDEEENVKDPLFTNSQPQQTDSQIAKKCETQNTVKDSNTHKNIEDFPSLQSNSSDDDDDEDFFDMVESGKIKEFLSQTDSQANPRCKLAEGKTVKKAKELDLSRFNSSSESEDDTKNKATKTEHQPKVASKDKAGKKTANSSKVEKKSASKSKDETKTPSKLKDGPKTDVGQEEIQKAELSTRTNSLSELRSEEKTEEDKTLSKSEKKRLRKEQGSVDAKKIKHQKSEQQRLDSFKQRQQETRNKKNAIQKALTKGNQAPNKKITFESESEEEGKLSKEKEQSTGPQLFNDDLESAEENDFRIRPEKEGKKGQKVMSMQEKIKTTDDRFKVDQRFVDSSESEEEPDIPEENSIEKEKQQYLDVLKTIVGEKKAMSRKPTKMFIDMNDLRYDPNKPESAIPAPPKERKHQDKEQQKEKHKMPEVSKATFSEVVPNLKERFNGGNASFSFLSMFGTPAVEEAPKEVPMQASVQEDFSDASSSEGEDEDEKKEEKDIETPEVEKKEEVKKNWYLRVPKDYIGEPFWRGNKEIDRAAWLEKRASLLELFRMKRKRALRQMRTGGYKPAHKHQKKSY